MPSHHLPISQQQQSEEVQRRAATLIIHAYRMKTLHYINSYGEKHLRFNPELYEQETQSYHENVRNKEIDANGYINGITI